jgi:phage FluMu protein Com
MITLTCDNCEKPITVPDTQGGTKIKCPHCGDVNVVPAVSAGSTPDRATAAGYPAADGPEQTIVRVRTAMFRSHPFAFLLCLLIVIGGIAGAIVLGGATPGAIACWVVAAAAALYFAQWKIRLMGSALEITNKRVIERVGLFSRFTSEVAHRDIRNIQVTQSFFERIMNVGKIGVSSAGQNDIEVVLKDVPNPDKIRKILDLYRPL